MTVEEMIRDVNSLPMQAQQQVADFIDFIKLKYPKNESATSEKKLTIEDSFGMFSVDKAITDEDIDNAVAHAMQEKYERIKNQ